MPNVLKDGLQHLTNYFKAQESEVITYSRRDQSVIVRAFMGEQLLKIDDGHGGFKYQYTDLDVMISADAEFTFGDGLIEPKRGDIVHRTVGVDVLQFEVFPYGGTESTYRFIHYRTAYRIHTRYIGLEQFYS